MTYASVSDVSTRLGRPITDTNEVAQVTAWLEDVEAIIKSRISDLDDKVADGDLATAVVVMVEANAVVRKMLNPDGKVAEGIDDYNYRYNENVRRGELFLTAEEWTLLETSSGAAFSITPYGEAWYRRRWTSTTEWVAP